jgi:lipopolysaccharide/colanic/teichoic acid biosynthesis glycosyltransferase
MAITIFKYGALKRGIDLLFSMLMLLILLPLFLVVAVVIKLDSAGPVFFRQERTGKNGKVFKIMKFRSMMADNDVRDASCDDKYTRFGKILRRTSIDELPQLINVLKGEMAFIGPRPWVPEYFENMNERERRRVEVRPGITGLAAAKGRNDLSIFEKINYDLEYVANYSLRQDVKVVFLTVKTVVSKEGAEAGKQKVHNEIADLMAENSR